ncbi:MAG: VanZ family protein [Planctomycetia bacterium]
MFFKVFRRIGPTVAASAYAVTLVLATHVPRPERFLSRVELSDKILHLVSYCLLASFTAMAVRSAGRWSTRSALGLAIALAAFGAIDEITQPLFSRRAELLDWAADCAGIAVGIAVVAIASSVWGRGSRKA